MREAAAEAAAMVAAVVDAVAAVVGAAAAEPERSRSGARRRSCGNRSHCLQ